MNILFVLVGILVFGLLIAVHELGHFLTAKACGVKVEEFSIGMGPALFKKQKGDTLYSLRLVPIGGYCAMAGEDEASEDPRAFTSQAPWKRALILVAGSVMNVVFGFVLILGIFSSAEAFNAPVIGAFMENCPYEGEEALQLGDRFLRIDGKKVRMYGDVVELLPAEGGEFDLLIRRDGKKIALEDFHMEPLEYEGQSRKMYGFIFGVDEATFANKIKYSWYSTLDFAELVWDGLRELVRGQVGVQDMAGPVGVVDMMTESAAQAATVWDGILDILYFGAFIAINLGIMNMLPIPALDGGRVFFLLVTWLIESIIGRKLDPKYEGYVHAAGMILLLALMAFIMFNDIIRIVVGK